MMGPSIPEPLDLGSLGLSIVVEEKIVLKYFLPLQSTSWGRDIKKWNKRVIMEINRCHYRDSGFPT